MHQDISWTFNIPESFVLLAVSDDKYWTLFFDIVKIGKELDKTIHFTRDFRFIY
ncbi:uncharacterized protein PHALS_03181 [Plasmopara halstedii]|uniref:Uncharacterized protein n=1 Tax=Plasmopara halstedii TaxID=4781 RepID=A0A0N7L390_PLAHL|nr:uncharacterized protein PHALS_03181 [Plasmopara halstedii]CEG35211.1 hypothetical protein PHALS_03181 [Plasmopara halstedii]|eukprot:XP_024571580.1 hypothetical protein PHALS_03181 [Plasmopara halstedii]